MYIQPQCTRCGYDDIEKEFYKCNAQHCKAYGKYLCINCKFDIKKTIRDQERKKNKGFFERFSDTNAVGNNKCPACGVGYLKEYKKDILKGARHFNIEIDAAKNMGKDELLSMHTKEIIDSLKKKY